MHTKDRILMAVIALLSALVGGIFVSCISSANHSEIRDVVQASKFILKDKNTNGYSTLEFVKGEPVLQFFSPDGSLRGAIGMRSKESFIELNRTDGSEVAVSPNDNEPGYHLFMLKSMGEGKGVFTSMLTSDELSIYQSKIGSVLIGNLGSHVGLRVMDSSDRVILLQPKSN
jgi:hypothetical protein